MTLTNGLCEMETPEIMSAEIIAGIREMFTSGDEWDAFGLMVELCDSHEELRRRLALVQDDPKAGEREWLRNLKWPEVK